MATFDNCFKGKRVLITGAGKGIGRALTLKFAELGATVYAVTRTQADLDTLITEAPTVRPIALDINDWDKVKTTLEEAITEPVDILVNNAAIVILESFMDVTSDGFDTVTGTNLKAVVNISQIFSRKLIDAGQGGTIINISSGWGVRPSTSAPIYSATKAALNALTKTMALELGKHQIRVVSMNLGYIWSNIWATAMGEDKEELTEDLFFEKLGSQFPLGKVFVPMNQAVDLILFVASGSVDMMTGNGICLDGGYCAN